MDDSTLPPTYSRFSLPVAYERVPVPTYTELAHTSERVLHSAPASPVASHDTLGPAYVYHTDHLEINLGRCPWGLQYAAYGRGGLINGSVRFTKKCSHVVKLTVTLLGSITIKAAEQPAMALPLVIQNKVVSKTITLQEGAYKKSESIPADKTYFFTIPFPEHVDGHLDTSLPPTFTTFHPLAVTDVGYSLQVDVVRKGLHRHEMISIPVLYFPKTQPLQPELPPDFLEVPNMAVTLDKRISRIAIEPKHTEDSSAMVGEIPSVNLLIPTSEAFASGFASGSTIPVAITINNPSSPAVVQALVPYIGLFLVKRKKIWVGNQIRIREQMVHKAEMFRMFPLSESEKYVALRLTAGEPGCESSFKVEGILEVEYFIRVVIRPPAYLRHLPVFQHDVPVKITTDQHGTLERELLTMNGVPMPALGLASSTLRRTIRSGS